MNRLLLALTITIILLAGLLLVFRPAADGPQVPFPGEPEPQVDEQVVLLDSVPRPRLADIAPAVTRQFVPDDQMADFELELAPATGTEAPPGKPIGLRRETPTDEAPSPGEIPGLESLLTTDESSPELPRRLPPSEPAPPRSISLNAPLAVPTNVLPPVIPAQAPEAEQVASILLHAGGAVEAQIPPAWKVFEASLRRQVYVVLMPPEAQRPTALRHDGIWLSHVALPSGQPWSEQNLDEQLDRRLGQLPGKPRVIQTNAPAMLGPWETRSVVYYLSAPNRIGSPAIEGEDILGGFMVVRTAWGLVEINSVAPRSVYESRQAVYQQFLQSIKLAAPAVPQPLTAEAAVAADLLGSWKSSRGRMRLHGDARFELLPDPTIPLAIHPAAPQHERPTVHRLAGEYEVAADVLSVRWNDGSQANYRWKLHEGELLLTDHQGRISRLSRLYE